MGGRVGVGGGGQRGLGHRFAAAWVRVRGCGRRLGTGTCVSVHQTTTMVVCGLGRAFSVWILCSPPTRCVSPCVFLPDCHSVCLSASCLSERNLAAFGDG